MIVGLLICLDTFEFPASKLPNPRRARTMLGRIAKTTFEIEPALQEQLVAGEHAEVEAIIHGYRTAQTDHRRAEALGLPNTLREL